MLRAMQSQRLQRQDRIVDTPHFAGKITTQICNDVFIRVLGKEAINRWSLNDRAHAVEQCVGGLADGMKIGKFADGGREKEVRRDSNELIDVTRVIRRSKRVVERSRKPGRAGPAGRSQHAGRAGQRQKERQHALLRGSHRHRHVGGNTERDDLLNGGLLWLAALKKSKYIGHGNASLASELKLVLFLSSIDD
ncbi:MAG TPA: hypothetical protein VNZ48_09500 [Xanthobacteraceae bacterium]|nr:hypothetical protein [Xanthobacteraceae bacterium]